MGTGTAADTTGSTTAVPTATWGQAPKLADIFILGW